MNRPPDELLASVAPIEIWRQAEKQAARSPHKRFKTGCVIYYGMNHGKKAEVYATGCAHPHAGGLKTYSTHAEQHAISRLAPGAAGAKAIIVTLTAHNNYATCSRPCAACAKALGERVWGWYYAELCNDGSWAIRSEASPLR